MMNLSEPKKNPNFVTLGNPRADVVEFGGICEGRDVSPGKCSRGLGD